MNILQRNNVKVMGERGPVLLYAHGFGCNQAMWRQITPAFAGKNRQVLFDYVGSGGSDLAAFDAQRYANLEGYVQDLLEVCEALDLTDGVTFVGHSIGCLVGLLASIQRPALFYRLVLLGPSPCFANHPPHYFGGFEREDLEGLVGLMEQNEQVWAYRLAPLVAGSATQGGAAGGAAGDEAGRVTNAVEDELTESFCATDPAAARVFARTTFFADHRADLARVSRPSLILQHRDDALVPLAVGDYLRAHLRGSTLRVLDVSGHSAHMSHPALVVEAMRDYLGRPGAAL